MAIINQRSTPFKVSKQGIKFAKDWRSKRAFNQDGMTDRQRDDNKEPDQKLF